jgi:hypothetical protein
MGSGGWSETLDELGRDLDRVEVAHHHVIGHSMLVERPDLHELKAKGAVR